MIYTIKKGFQDSSNPLSYQFHRGITSLKGKIKFYSNCQYDFSDKPDCINDTNKAIGFGYGTYPWAHHKWSIRLGWRCNRNKKLILLLYCYVNGVRVEKRIGLANTFKWDTEYDFEIINDQINKVATIKIGFETVSIPFNKTSSSGYYLYPWFGGDCSAPHDMNIEIKFN